MKELTVEVAKKTAKNDRPKDVGPDPVWGLGIFFVGLLTMGIGGATTRHWMFNVGEGLLLLGVAIFVTCVAVTAHRQEHLGKRLRAALRGQDNDKG